MAARKTLSLLVIATWMALVLAPVVAPAEANAATLTSITIDPADQSGSTTNAPGAWSTNTGDPLSQAGVRSAEGTYLNNGHESGNLGEIAIELSPGVTTLNINGNGVFPGNMFYNGILFFDNVAVNPQIAVYNQNGTLGSFKVNPQGATIMGGANGGLFFDKAPGKSVHVARDGTTVEVLSFVINSMSSNADEISFGQVGADGHFDTTAQLILRVTPPQNLKGCVELKGIPVVGSEVDLNQPKELSQTTYTDEDGCYRFEELVSGKKFTVNIKGPIVP
jgi:hypothetical protein